MMPLILWTLFVWGASLSHSSSNGVQVFALALSSSSPQSNNPSKQVQEANQSAPTSIVYRPSRVAVTDVTISYPETLMGKLFSSVPKRKYAVDHITTSFGSSGDGLDEEPVIKSGDNTRMPTVLVGRSASGKSTLLRLITGEETPTSGTVTIEGSAKPIIIDRKPPLDDSKSVLGGILAAAPKGNDLLLQRQGNELMEEIAMDFATTLGLASDQLQSKPSSLSPSGQFLFGLACGCMCSVIPSLSATVDAQEAHGNTESSLSGPILLLDELFDFEHPDVAAKCCPGIDSLIENMGAVVIIATHKPHHWESLAMRRAVALSKGRILSEEVVERGKSTTMLYK